MFNHSFDVVDRQCRVQLLKLPANCRHHALLFASCPDNHRQEIAILRKKVSVNEGSGIFAQTKIFTVLNYTDDFYPWAAGTFGAEAFADCRLARPESARKEFIDQTDTLRFSILFRKISPFQQSCPQGCNKTGRSIRGRCNRSIQTALFWLAFDIDRAVVQVQAQRYEIR